MSQRVYLPTDIELNIGTIELSLDTTNLSLSATQTLVPYRTHGELYDRLKSGRLTRRLGISGLYDGSRADSFKALQGGNAVATRLLIDKGQSNRIHAGMLLAADYEIDTSGDAVIVTGSAEFTGTVYIGQGAAALSDDFDDLSIDYDVGVIVVETAGVESGTGSLRLRATASAVNYDATVDLRETTGTFIVPLPATGTGDAARPSSGDWDVTLTALSYSTSPVLTWGMVKPEGVF